MDGSWTKDKAGRLSRVVMIDGIRHRQFDHAQGQVRPIEPPPSKEQNSAIRYDPTPKTGDLSSYVRSAEAQDGQNIQQPSQTYVVASAGRYDSQNREAYSRLDERRVGTQETSQTTPYTLFPRDDVRQDTQGASQHGEPARPRNISRSSIRSGSTESRDSEHRTLYRATQEREGATETAIQQVGRPPRAPRQELTSNYSGHALDTRQAGPTQRASSLLSRLAQEFIQISVGSYAECERFMLANPSIFHEQPNRLVDEAVRFTKEGNSPRARACIQQSLLLRKCSKMTDKERRSFFVKMTAKDAKTLQDFLSDFDKIVKAATTAASQAGPTNPPSDQRMKPINENKPLTIHQHDQRRPILDTRLSRNSAACRNSIDDQISAPLAALAIDDPYSTASNNATTSSVMGPPPPSDRGPTERRLTVSSNESVGDNLSIVPDIRGSKDADDLRETLNPKYYKRPDAKKFFVKGRVFALLWHQSAGQSRSGLELSEAQYSTTGKFGERVFSHIQRMAVVRERHGYCICVPINTYNGNGVLKRGLTDEECRAHSIIHSSDKNPACKAGERALMTKKPIMVNMASPEQKLDEMSRIHFGKAHTVEWNVKVMNVGKVSPDSLANFMGYYQLESN